MSVIQRNTASFPVRSLRKKPDSMSITDKVNCEVHHEYDFFAE
jgi:hypothetical protein